MFSLKGFIVGAIISIIYLISEYLDSKHQFEDWYLIGQQKNNSIKELKEFEFLFKKQVGISVDEFKQNINRNQKIDCTITDNHPIESRYESNNFLLIKRKNIYSLYKKSF